MPCSGQNRTFSITVADLETIRFVREKMNEAPILDAVVATVV